MKRKVTITCICLLSTLMLVRHQVWATVRLPAVFGDHMVLQRNVKVPVWGWAKPGEQVQIIFKGKLFKTQAGTDGKWALKINKYSAGGPYEMTIKDGDGQLIVKDILIGDVWVTSGQSNMEFGIQNEEHGADAIAKATDSLIHFFFVPFASALQPQDDIVKQSADSPNGKWVVCSPQLMADPKWAWHGFSAAGYYFAQQIRKTTGAPVGMIGTYKGGTAAQAWMSLAALQQKPEFSAYVSKYETLVAHYEEVKVAYPQLQANYQQALKQWNTEVGDNYAIALKQWEAAAALTKAAGDPTPMRPKPSRPAPQNPAPPDGGFNSPTNLYNAMIMPILHYGIKGVIWYQGESNGDRLNDAVLYKDLFPGMITDWRNNWGQGNFPFLFVQLANYHAPAVSPSEGNWPWVRDAQLKTLSLPQTGMAVITDIGNADNIHPTNKLDVGLRLSLIARHMVYGESLVYSGPVLRSMKTEGNKIRLTFNDTGSGLAVGRNARDAGIALKGFGIAGADQKFVWATAVIEGNTVVVSSSEVTDPVAVRYNWADNPPGDLYNKESLPAGPFRTDSWAPPLNAK